MRQREYPIRLIWRRRRRAAKAALLVLGLGATSITSLLFLSALLLPDDLGIAQMLAAWAVVSTIAMCSAFGLHFYDGRE